MDMLRSAHLEKTDSEISESWKALAKVKKVYAQTIYTMKRMGSAKDTKTNTFLKACKRSKERGILNVVSCSRAKFAGILANSI